MEGVGARLGRSSTRYGPATVFNGPVRKWKKQWVHVRPPNSNNHSNSHSNHQHHHHNRASNNGNANGSNGSHLLLFKWTPITPSQNNSSNSSNGDAKKDDVVAIEEPPRRKFKYIPIAVLDEQRRDAATEQIEDEAKPSDTDMNEADLSAKNDDIDEKPDINDVPVEDRQAAENSPPARQDLNESTLDLSLGLKAHDRDNDPDSKADIQDN